MEGAANHMQNEPNFLVIDQTKPLVCLFGISLEACFFVVGCVFWVNIVELYDYTIYT